MMSGPLTALLAVSFFALAGGVGVERPVQPAPEDEAAPGEGRELFIARCTACHSVDYVAMHARFGTRALWEMEVAKMRNAFKAPLTDEDARRIVDYLERAYGPSAHDGQ